VSASAATLAGHACTRVRVQVPAWGLWWADVDLAEPETVSGRVSLVVADKTLSGTVMAGGVSNGRAAYRVVGGAGGWGRTIPKKAYRSDFGLTVAKIVGDAATAVGETVSGAPTTKQGPHYVRRAEAASRTLHLLAPRTWYVDFEGVTRFGARTSVTYTGDGTRTRPVPEARIVEIATDTIGDLVPGVIVDDLPPASDVEYELDDKRLTVRVYASAASTRRLSAIAKIVEALFPNLKYSGAYEFRVVGQTGDRLDLQPARVATGMPELSGVPVRPGMAGLRANVTLGEHVLVVFADADPSRPQVIAHEAPDEPGWMPLTLELGGPGALGVARTTDAVVAGPFGGTIVGGSARVKASL
jgi:hypothetical protein